MQTRPEENYAPKWPRISIKLGLILLLLTSTVLYAAYRFIEAPQTGGYVREAIEEKLRSEAATGGLKIMNERLSSPQMVYRVYLHHGFGPLWLSDSVLGPQYRDLLSSIEQAYEDGLRPQDYHQKSIESLLAHFALSPALNDADSMAWLDILLTDAFLTLSSDLYAGRAIRGNVHRSQHLQGFPYEQVLLKALEDNRVSSALRQLTNPGLQYLQLKELLAGYRLMKDEGRWPYIALFQGTSSPGVSPEIEEALRKRFAQTREIKPGMLHKALPELLKNYQENNGLPPTGSLDAATLQSLNTPAEERILQIEQNMERRRWLPRQLPEEYFQINIADFSLQAIRHDTEALKMKIIVGTVYQQTPVFYANMKHVVINPYWDVPYSIATKEILPQLKRNPGYLARHHMELYSSDLKVKLNPYKVNWHAVSAANFPYRIRQLPGSWNALGRIKFLFPNHYNVYLHGTPNTELFEQDVRAFSHGCMRVEDPVRLAEYVFRNEPAGDKKAILRQIEEGKEKWIGLDKPIPVLVCYWTCWIDHEGTVHFRNDVYGRDTLLPA